MKKKQVITGLTAAALIAGTAVPGAFAAQVTSSGAMTLTVGSPYLMNNGTSSLIDTQGNTGRGEPWLYAAAVARCRGDDGRYIDLEHNHPADCNYPEQ